MRFTISAMALSALTLTFATSTANARAICPRQSPDDVVAAMRDMFSAFETHNQTAVRARLAPNFYAFDGGQRMDGMTLPDLIAKQQATGAKYKWSVTKPDVQMNCTLATIAYVNVGAVGDTAKMTPVTWLESAVLRFREGRWRVQFLISAPVRDEAS